MGGDILFADGGPLLSYFATGPGRSVAGCCRLCLIHLQLRAGGHARGFGLGFAASPPIDHDSQSHMSSNRTHFCLLHCRIRCALNGLGRRVVRNTCRKHHIIAVETASMSRPTIPSKRPAEEQEAAWIADEDRFALEQAKKKAALRVKGGRGQPIDVLAVALVAMEPARSTSGFEEETEGLEDLPIDPEGAFEGLSEDGLRELEKSIEGYEVLESSRNNKDYWSVSHLRPCAESRAC